MLLLAGCVGRSNSNDRTSTPATGDAGTSTSVKNTCLAIVDGQPSVAYPATHLLSSPLDKTGNNFFTCTGTFISDNSLVTSAHCVPTSGSADLHVLSNGATVANNTNALSGGTGAVAAFFSPSIIIDDEGHYGAASPADDYLDVAIVVFPDHTSAASIPLGTQPAAVGTSFTVVGYGSSDIDGDTKPVSLDKKNGTNVVAASIPGFPSLNLYQVKAWAHPGEAQANGATTVSSAPGDSGGPMLVGDQMIGIVKGGYSTTEVPDLQTRIGTDALDIYVDLTTAAFRELLQRAKDGGAHIATTDQPPAAPAPPAPKSQLGCH